MTVDPHLNVFLHDKKGFSNYQLWILLHELVHYYTLATGDGGLDIEPEGSYFANYCLALPARLAINHAYSYVYFVAGEFVRACLEAWLSSSNLLEESYADEKRQISGWAVRSFLV